MGDEVRIEKRRRSLMVLALIGLLILPAGYQAWHSLQRIETWVEAWLPDGAPEVALRDEFQRDFESVDTIVVSWPGCTVDDQRQAEVVQSLTSGSTAPQLDGEPVVENVISGCLALRKLQTPPVSLTRQDAIGALKGNLVGQDESSSCVIVTLAPAASRRPRTSLELVQRRTSALLDLQTEEMIWVGGAVEAAASDRATIESVQIVGPVSILLIGLLTWSLTRSRLLTLSIVAVSTLVPLVVLALISMPWIKPDPLLIVSVLLSQLLAVMLCLTAWATLRLSLPEQTQPEQTRTGRTECGVIGPAAVRTLTMRLVGAGLIVSAGLLAAAWSPLAVFRDFGILAAIGTAVSVLLVRLVVVPVCLASELRWPPSGRRKQPVGSSDNGPSSERPGWLASSMALIVLLASVATAWTQWPDLKLSLDMHSVFGEASEIVESRDEFEQRMGPLIPLELAIRFPADSGSDVYSELSALREAGQELSTRDETGAVVSVGSLLPDWFFEDSVMSSLARMTLSMQLDTFREADLLNSATDPDGTSDAEGRSWRMTVRVRSRADGDYRATSREIEQALSQSVNASFGAGNAEAASDSDVSPIEVRVTGMMSVVNAAEIAMARESQSVLLRAFIAIVLALVMVIRRVGPCVMVLAVSTAPLAIGISICASLLPSIGAGMAVALLVAFNLTVPIMTLQVLESQMFESGRRGRFCPQWKVLVVGAIMLTPGLLCSFPAFSRLSAMLTVLLLLAAAGSRLAEAQQRSSEGSDGAILLTSP